MTPTNTPTMNIFSKLLARQLGRNYRDTSLRGSGNRSARRAISTEAGAEHIKFANEDTYTDRPAILTRGASLLRCNRDFHPMNEASL